MRPAKYRLPVFALALASLPGLHALQGPAFYVSPAGDDSNPGTQKAPWRTIQHAANVASAGSTVNVRAEGRTKSESRSTLRVIRVTDS
ncbi:MAG: DUF1565 domain-containing protein [Bryobacteraceae bacterium]